LSKFGGRLSKMSLKAFQIEMLTEAV